MSNIVNKNRSFIMGVAILWVVLYHIPVHTSISVLKFIQDIGYGGVDIFVFISGYGVYKSLDRDDNAYRFMARRLKRLLPSYIPFIIVWMIIRYITYQLYVTEIAGNLTMTGWWNGSANQFNWYIDGIILFYLIAPYVYGMLKGNRKLLIYVVLVTVAMLISVAFWHGILLTAMSRLPLFIIGMIIASDSDNRALCTSYKLLNILMLLGFVILYYFLNQNRFDRWHYGLWWYPFILITPGLIYDIGAIGTRMCNVSILKSIRGLICGLGEASFEIFLIHIFVLETAESREIQGNLIWFILCVFSVCAGWLYRKLVLCCMSRMSRSHS